MKRLTIITTIIALLALASCGSSEPEWADPEAHEKTEQLRNQYTPLIAGTWHCEHIGDRQRFFERLTFQEDGTLKGYRKWETRSLVTIDGEQRYTDWEAVNELNGTFTGTWSLKWERDAKGVGANRLILYASFDALDNEGNGWMAYSHNVLFDYDSATTTLRIAGLHHQDADGWASYQHGDAEPSF